MARTAGPVPLHRRPRREIPRGRAEQKPAGRPVLSREAIVGAALRIVDAEGIDAVTMRRVAEQLETGAASLYAHVADKDELLELAFDHVLADVPLPDRPSPRGWRDQLRQLARDLHDALLEHRDIARLAMGRMPVGPNALRGYEAMLGLMRAGNLEPATAGLGADMLVAVVAGSAYEASLWLSRDKDGDYAAHLEAVFAALPADRFPTIASMVPELVGGDEDDGMARFEFKLDVLIAGLAAQAKRKA